MATPSQNEARFEAIAVDPEVGSRMRIKQAAVRQGMRTLRDDGWRKAMDGMTTVDEVLRITKGDQDLAELDKLVH